MIRREDSIFETLKQKHPVSNRTRQVSQLFFQLIFIDNQANLLIINKNRETVKVDFRDFHGQTRDLLKAIDFIESKNRLLINWKKSKIGINLAEYGFLLPHLKKNDNFVDKDLNPISFESETGILEISINGEPQLICELVLTHAGKKLRNIQFINENHVLCDGTIYPIMPTGADCSLLTSFETMIFPSELEKYLSLLHSNCAAINVNYKNYRVIDGPGRKTKPCLILEKTGPDNSLYLKVSDTLPGFAPDFFDSYDITKIAVINELENSIEVNTVFREEQRSVHGTIEKTLYRIRRELDETEEADFFRDENLFIIEAALAEKLVQEELPHMIANFLVFGSEKLETYRVQMVQPDLCLSVNHGIDFLDGEADLNINGERFSLFEALHQFRQNSYIQLNDGTRALLNRDYVEKLERIFKKKKDGIEISFFDLPLLDELIDEKISNDFLARPREIFNGFNNLRNIKIPLPKINAELRPYQKEGYKWLKYLEEHSLGGCLADDMGLGKTLQAIALLSSVYPAETISSLIIIPKSLIFNWRSEIEKFNPDLSCYLYYGQNRDLETAKQYQLVITTYGTLRSDIESLKEEEFYYLILDESQTIKNSQSGISRAVMLLQAKKRLALSGTPIENNLSELYSLFRFLNPSMFGNRQTFARQYLLPIQQNGDIKKTEELKKKIFPFIMRRLKKDVLDDLPDKIEHILYVDMSPEQKKFYEQRRTFYYETVRNQIECEGIEKTRFFILQAITVLRQIASIPELKSEGQIISPKREILLENLLDSVANGHKVLLFANFLAILDFLAEDLKAHDIDYVSMTGATVNREIPVKRFQNDPACKVFLMTLKTGGQGLNLTAADTIYIYDPWWNVAAENQAIDRSHRIGQDKTVFSYKFITRETIEEKIVKLQQKKSALFEDIISSDTISGKFLDEENIDYLLG